MAVSNMTHTHPHTLSFVALTHLETSLPLDATTRVDDLRVWPFAVRCQIHVPEERPSPRQTWVLRAEEVPVPTRPLGFRLEDLEVRGPGFRWSVCPVPL